MFKTKEIKTDTLGKKLKKAREATEMALWQVSRKTKVPINYLEHLEEGNYKELPADVYVVAYLRKYAKVLNLDIEEVLEQFKTERRITESLPRSLEDKDNSSSFIKKPSLVVTPKRLSLVLGIIAIALVFGYFWHQLSYLLNPPVIRLSQPASDLAIQEKSIEILGQTEPDAYLTINGREVYLDNKGYFKSVINLELGLNILKIEAKDRFGKVNTVIRRVMVTR